MNKNFSILSRTEAAATAAFASVLSVVTVGAVVAMFATVSPVETTSPIVLEKVVVSAVRSA